MGADGAVGGVVGDDDDDVGAVLGRRRQLLAGHQEIPVAGEADHLAPGVDQLGGDGRGQAIAHRPGGRGELGRPCGVPVEPVQPSGEIAGAVADDGVRRQRLGHVRDDLRKVHLAGDWDRPAIGLVIGAAIRAPFGPPRPRLQLKR